jgi:hypothetical protein
VTLRPAGWLALAALLAAAPGLAAAAEGRRFALVAGEAEGGPGTQRLRHAERDARRIHGILTRVGGVRAEDATLLIGEGVRAFRRALTDLSARAQAAHAAGERTLLLVYFSGHAKDGALRFGAGGLPLAELREALQAAPADVRIGLLDACRSGAIARTKGVRPAPDFQVTAPGEAGPRGLVLITSSAADEESQESDALGASYFTHSLASGLLGDADASGDGKVTLAEAYAHAYGRTVGATAGTAGGAQHPAFLYDLGGAGDVVLTELSPSPGGLLFPEPLEGLYVVLDAGGRAVAEVSKPAGVARRLSLAPGRYTVKRRLPGEEGLLVATLQVAGQPVRVEEGGMDRVALAKDPQKGFGGARWSLVAGLGTQRFFEPSGATGLFPQATLAGLELASRDDLGHGLAWGLDLSLGGAQGTLRLEGLEPIGFRSTEVAAGASLWHDWRVGPVTLSAGGRVALIWLGRTFDQAEQLPPQYFFTATPGLTASASWRITDRFSALLRGRVSWLFYNVDEDRSLGYADVLLGVEYALSD